MIERIPEGTTVNPFILGATVGTTAHTSSRSTH